MPQDHEYLERVKERATKRRMESRDDLLDAVPMDGVASALGDHALGKRIMSASQVSAGKALMDKVVPSLQSVEMKVEHDIAGRLRRARERFALMDDDVETTAREDGSE